MRIKSSKRKKIEGWWNWKKNLILQIISNTRNSNKKNMDQIWRKNKLKDCFENLKC